MSPSVYRRLTSFLYSHFLRFKAKICFWMNANLKIYNVVLRKRFLLSTFGKILQLEKKLVENPIKLISFLDGELARRYAAE